MTKRKKFEDLQTKYGEGLARYCILLIKHNHGAEGYTYGAEDLCQDTWTRVWEKLEDIKMELNPRAFIFEIAKNRLRDVSRKKTSELRRLESIAYKMSHSLSDKEKQREHQKKIAASLRYVRENLKPEHQKIFAMRVWDGLSSKDIGERVGKEAHAVDNIIHRMRKELREYIQKIFSLFLGVFLCACIYYTRR